MPRLSCLIALSAALLAAITLANPVPPPEMVEDFWGPNFSKTSPWLLVPTPTATATATASPNQLLPRAQPALSIFRPHHAPRPLTGLALPTPKALSNILLSADLPVATSLPPILPMERGVEPHTEDVETTTKVASAAVTWVG